MSNSSKEVRTGHQFTRVPIDFYTRIRTEEFKLGNRDHIIYQYLCSRLNNGVVPGRGLTEKNWQTQALEPGEIQDVLGYRKETISRSLHKLKNLGYINWIETAKGNRVYFPWAWNDQVSQQPVGQDGNVDQVSHGNHSPVDQDGQSPDQKQSTPVGQVGQRRHASKPVVAGISAPPLDKGLNKKLITTGSNTDVPVPDSESRANEKPKSKSSSSEKENGNLKTLRYNRLDELSDHTSPRNNTNQEPYTGDYEPLKDLTLTDAEESGKRDLVQVRHPKGHYILIERTKGVILGNQEEPFDGVPLRGDKDEDPESMDSEEKRELEGWIEETVDDAKERLDEPTPSFSHKPPAFDSHEETEPGSKSDDDIGDEYPAPRSTSRRIDKSDPRHGQASKSIDEILGDEESTVCRETRGHVKEKRAPLKLILTTRNDEKSAYYALTTDKRKRMPDIFPDILKLPTVPAEDRPEIGRHIILLIDLWNDQHRMKTELGHSRQLDGPDQTKICELYFGVMKEYEDLDYEKTYKVIRKAMVRLHQSPMAGDVSTPGYYLRHSTGTAYVKAAVEEVRRRAGQTPRRIQREHIEPDMAEGTTESAAEIVESLDVPKKPRITEEIAEREEIRRRDRQIEITLELVQKICDEAGVETLEDKLNAVINQCSAYMDSGYDVVGGEKAMDLVRQL